MNYKLSSGVFFVRGALNGALLDTNTGNVYSISDGGVSVLVGELLDKNYVQSLVDLGLLQTSSTASPIQQFAATAENTIPNLDFIWFEVVTDDCNERCIHCYVDSMPPAYRENVPARTQRQKMSHQDWLRAISDAKHLGSMQCQFIGGEPFLYKGQGGEDIFDLAEHALASGFRFVEIFTNGTLITEKRVKRIKSMGLHMAISLYSIDPQIHDTITRTPGSNALTVKAIERLVKVEVPLRVEVIVMRQNEGSVEATLEWLHNLGIEGASPDPLRPNGRGNEMGLNPSFNTLARWGLMLEPDFEVSEDMLRVYSTSDSCLGSRIAITDSGQVLPCIFSRDKVYGNVLEESLAASLAGPKAVEVRSGTKDKVLVCKDCEYRYVCVDCRPLATGHFESDFGPNPRCTYNPYTGEWAHGLWIIGADGVPIYDRSEASRIQCWLAKAQSC